jgi:hypothetical protein
MQRTEQTAFGALNYSTNDSSPLQTWPALSFFNFAATELSSVHLLQLGLVARGLGWEGG